MNSEVQPALVQRVHLESPLVDATISAKDSGFLLSAIFITCACLNQILTSLKKFK